MNYYLGIDIGATKSHALITNQAGLAIGFGAGGPGNYESVGWQGLIETLQVITKQALSMSGIKADQIVGAGFGVAGYDWLSERQPTLDAINSLGLRASIEAVNDAVIGLLAGAREGWGIAIIAGTGENCWGIDPQRNLGRMTGNSLLMDEYGGASTIVYKAIREIARQWGMRGPATQLSQVFMEHVGADSIDDLLEGLAMQKYCYSAKLAPLVFEVAENGDGVAIDVIEWAAKGLADMVTGVTRQLSFEEREFDVVMSGSVFKGGKLILDPMKAAIREVAPKSRFVHLTSPPVIGGVLLGMEQTGFDGYKVHDNLVASTNAIIDSTKAHSIKI